MHIIHYIFFYWNILQKVDNFIQSSNPIKCRHYEGSNSGSYSEETIKEYLRFVKFTKTDWRSEKSRNEWFRLTDLAEIAKTMELNYSEFES